MVPEVVLAPEALPTNVAWVWSLVRVRSFVDEQVVRFGEVSTAESADVLLARSVWSEGVGVIYRSQVNTHLLRRPGLRQAAIRAGKEASTPASSAARGASVTGAGTGNWSHEAPSNGYL